MTHVFQRTLDAVFKSRFPTCLSFLRFHDTSGHQHGYYDGQDRFSEPRGKALGDVEIEVVMARAMRTVRDVLADLDKPSMVERFVLNHGRSFQPVPRPAGMRRRKADHSFSSTGSMALDGLGLSYVEGFAMGIDESRLVHHAWLTPDGLMAIDLVADDATHRTYFGIPFSTPALAEIIGRRSIHGLLDPVDSTVTRAMVRYPYSA